ncbi:preprotein translocase subunit SecD [Herbihabitans rhizosphaerae]|uniref:Preprotein translocase subunit SecD n=1 Tax=Herbihabitans rhizosphaerae TaxID=1872711 RepID=A0A4Q7KRA6_9PSEU|nr:preprotein translocase subunit SecD [Herbihabitans rhizosphaerae]
MLAGCTSKTGGEAGPSASPTETSRPGPVVSPVTLEFRKVVAEAPANTPAPPGTAGTGIAGRQATDQNVLRATMSTLDCKAEDPLRGKDDPKLPLVTCDHDGEVRYLLDPSALSKPDVDRAEAKANPNGTGWIVALSFTSSGATKWADFTTKNVQQQVAVVVDTRVISAPQIQSPITGGNTEITGNFTVDEARRLADALNGD